MLFMFHDTMLSCLIFEALWEGLALLCVMFSCVLVTFQCGLILDRIFFLFFIDSEYDQEIPKSQTVASYTCF